MRNLKNKSINIGGKFSKWTVLERVEAPNNIKNKNNSFWLCVCMCGTQQVLTGGKLRNKRSKGCRKCSMLNKRKAKGHCSFNGLYLRYKHGALSRSLEFALSSSEFKTLIDAKCHYCRAMPTSVHKGRTAYGEYVYNGVDRIDSSLGYTVTNCVTACKICNRAKGSMDYFDFLKWIKNLSIS